MAVNLEFSDILKSHPELAITSKTEERVPQPGDIDYNPFFMPMTPPPQPSEPDISPKQEEAQIDITPKQEEQPAAKEQPDISPKEEIVQPEAEPIKVKAFIAIEEDSNDDDPALIAVANRPESKVEVGTAIKNVETKEEKPVEEAPKTDPPKRRRTRKVETPAAENTDITPKQEEQSADITDVTVEEKDPAYFKERIGLLEARYFDKDFSDYTDTLAKRATSIVITDDLNTGMSKVKLAEIDALRNEIFAEHTKVKILKKAMTKEYGDIYVQGKLHSVGNNESERTRNSLNFLSNFILQGKATDIPYILTVLNMYETLFDSVQKLLEDKYKSLILILGNNKIDASFT